MNEYNTRELYTEQEPETVEELQYGDEIPRVKKVRKKKHYFLRFLIFIGVIVIALVFSHSDFFLIKTIDAEGNAYYSAEELMNMAGAQLKVNLLWDIDTSEMEETLLENPYYTDVQVKRKLPDTLCFVVEERKQIAAIAYGEKYIVIDKDGTVLRKATVDPKITLLSGLTISKLSVGNKVEAEETSTLETTLNMLSTMEDGDIYFKKIDVSRVIIKAYIYDTLLVKGTPKQMTKAIQSGDLQKVVNNLLKNDTTRGTINLGDHNYMSFSPEF